MRIFAYLGAKGGNRMVMKFCIGVGVPDVIIHANFCALPVAENSARTQAVISSFNLKYYLMSFNEGNLVHCFL